jgi:hypothetical protein
MVSLASLCLEPIRSSDLQKVHSSLNSNGGYAHPPMLPSQQSYLPRDYRSGQSLSTLGTQSYDAPTTYAESSAPSIAQFSGKASSRFNLIGSRAATAFILKDTEQKTGVWFVLQDLSIRHEEFYR